jgi:hypothetical protein
VAADEEPFVDFIEAHFDSDFYLRIHVDVAKAGIDAAEHFFTHGIGENRRFSPYVDMHHRRRCEFIARPNLEDFSLARKPHRSPARLRSGA